MATIVFDTLEHAKKLRTVGLTDMQAETHAWAIAELVRVLNDKMATKEGLQRLEIATKEDIKRLEIATKADFKRLEMATKEDIKHLEMVTKEDIKRLEMATKEDIKRLERATKKDLKILETRLTHNLTMRLGSMMLVSLGAFTTVVKLFV